MKNIIIGVLCFVIGVLLFKGCSDRNEFAEMQGKYLFADSAYMAEKQESKRWKTKDSLNVLQVNALQVDKKALTEYAEGLRNELKAAKIKPSNVKQVVSITTETKGEITPEIDTIYTVKTDTIGVDTLTKFNYSDKWLSMNGTIRPKFAISYNVKDSLQIVSHWKRDGLFKPLKLRITAYSKNPNVTITGLKEFEVKERPKRFFLGVGGSYGFNGQRFCPTVGIVAGFKLFTF